MTESSAKRAAAAIRSASALVITAGAGMGVDSGLPDFRGDAGFWKAYPPYERLGISFVEAANPSGFEGDPAFGWGFYGHRLNLYRSTVPHDGFQILRRWIRDFDLEHFVVTSNVDGQFQKAGFDDERILEVHGSIHFLQCTSPCGDAIWPNREQVDVDHTTMRAAQVPRCPRCGAVSRPNILMFGDYAWLPDRTHEQQARYDDFLRAQRGQSVVAIEMGAGTAIPTIRFASERSGGLLVRINPREPHVPDGHVSMPVGALEGLSAIDAELKS